MQPGVERVRVPCGGHEVVADVHVRDDTGPPVLFLHGILTSTAVVRDLFDDPAGASWVSVSLPGHQPGRLARGTPAAALDAEFFAEFVDAALAAVVGRRRVVAVGWSTGGFAALNLAIRRPERVAAVASLAGFASGTRVVGSVAWLTWLASAAPSAALVRGGLWAGSRMPWLHDLILGTAAGDCTAARTIDAGTRGRLWREFAGHDPAALASVLASLRELDVADRLGEIAVPAWIVAGTRDPLVPLVEARRIAAAIPRSRLTVYEGAGHLFFHEWPAFRAEFAAWRAGLAAAEA
jgi:pimeloyl-ACP methyl ester carboxylesterase